MGNNIFLTFKRTGIGLFDEQLGGGITTYVFAPGWLSLDVWCLQPEFVFGVSSQSDAVVLGVCARVDRQVTVTADLVVHVQREVVVAAPLGPNLQA